MANIGIPKEEFLERSIKLKKLMQRDQLDAVLVYGDEYRKENLRYVCNYWPIFERAAMVMRVDGDPIVLCAPEGEKIAEEMSVWGNLRLLPDFVCVTVPDEIEYPQATYSSLPSIADELNKQGKISRLGVVGMDAMSAELLEKIKKAFACEVINANALLFEMRLVKSQNEIACLREAARIADAGYRKLLGADLIGKTERYAAGLAEGEARAEGAEAIIFTVVGTGERTNTIVGRPANKVIEDGDMFMCSLAIQYEGYVATCEFPFAVGNYSEDTKRVINILVRAYLAGIQQLKPGNKMKNMVQAVKDCFRQEGVAEYDVYPPLHGIGCAEAESPYPDETVEEVFLPGMTVNTDISLFGMPGGANRVEAGFVITESGAEPLSPLVDEYCKKWAAENG